MDDESISIVFLSFESFENQHVCFHLSDALQTTRLCSNERFPLTLYRIGSWSLSIEPEFIWTLVQYEIQIDKFKKGKTSIRTNKEKRFYFSVTKFYQIDFDDVEQNLLLPLPNSSDPFVHFEWLVTQKNVSSRIIFDVENSDEKTSADLLIIENIDADRNNLTSFALGSIVQKRFSHISFAPSKSFRIIYQSVGLSSNNQKRSFRLHLHKLIQPYFHANDFHYIVHEVNETVTLQRFFFVSHHRSGLFSRKKSEWLIEGQNETSTFIGQIFLTNEHLTLQTTADVNLSVADIWKEIRSSDFHLRSASEFSSRFFVVILYEKMFEQLDEPVRLTKANGVMKTFDQMSFQIEIDSQRFDLLDLIIVQGDLDMIIHLSDRSKLTQRDEMKRKENVH